jgi:hypothetical protein
VDGDGILDVNETWLFASGAYTVAPDSYTNRVLVSTSDSAGLVATDDDTNNHVGIVITSPTASIRVEKAINAVDPNNPTTAEDADVTGPELEAGSTVTWTYQVFNTGEVALSIDQLVDDAGTAADTSDDFEPGYVGGDVNGNNLLDVDETWLFASNTYTVVEGDYTNTVTVAGTSANGDAVTDDDANNHVGITIPVESAIRIEKYILVGDTSKGNNGVGNGLDPQPPGDPRINDGIGTEPGSPGNIGGADDGTNGDLFGNGTLVDADSIGSAAYLQKGSLATWFYEVYNEGDTTLTITSLVDDAGTPNDPGDDFTPVYLSGDLDEDGLLDPDEVWLFTSAGAATHKVTDGEYTNIVEVVATVDGSTEIVFDTDSNTHIGVTGKGNNGVGNGLDPQPPGEPPINDGEGTSPGDPGNRPGNQGGDFEDTSGLLSGSVTTTSTDTNDFSAGNTGDPIQVFDEESGEFAAQGSTAWGEEVLVFDVPESLLYDDIEVGTDAEDGWLLVVDDTPSQPAAQILWQEEDETMAYIAPSSSKSNDKAKK